MKNENMVVVQFSAEAYGVTGLNKQEFEAILANAIKCDFTITASTGEKVNLEIITEVQVDNISVCDEDGIEIESAEEVSY